MKFLVTFELGKLAKWLRILGYDTEYCRTFKKSELIIKSLREQRIILTHNTKLKTTGNFNVVYIKSESVIEQLNQVVQDLKFKIQEEDLFSRCLICNTVLRDIDKEQIKSKIPPYVFNTQSFFLRCPNCERIYWPGTHWENARMFLTKMKV